MSKGVPHLRTSERTALKRCPQMWQWRYRNGLVKKTLKPDARWFGTGIHLALQERYRHPGLKRGKNVLKVWREYVGDNLAYVRTNGPQLGQYALADEPEWVSALELGEAMLGAYLDRYGLDARWHVISAEQTFEIPIPNPRYKPTDYYDMGDRTIVYYNGTFDLVARDTENEDSLWLWDHKTAQQITTGHLALDDQAGSYWALAADVLAAQGLVPKGTILDGILYNFLRKTKPDARPRNADGLYTNKPKKEHYLTAIMDGHPESYGYEKWTLKELQALCDTESIIVYGDVSATQPPVAFLREQVFRTRSERRTQIQRIQSEALLAEQYRTKQLPIIKTPTRDCSWCDFFDMCQLHEAGGDWQTYRDSIYTKQNPYADHMKSAAE